jgi:hypothetical protein
MTRILPIIVAATLSICCGPGDSSGAAPAAPTPSDPTAGWKLTVYYTAVERFHRGRPRAVVGCLVLECANGSSALGTYPADFVQAVEDEGAGRITSGSHAGMFLNWSIGIGYWLDVAARDARGEALDPYVSAAADPAYAFDTPITVVGCGVDDSTHEAIDPEVCQQLKAAHWIVRDRFTHPQVGKQLDLYIGEENQPEFAAKSPKVISAVGATVSISSQGFASSAGGR